MSKVKLSKQEAAEFLGVSPRTVERYAQRGNLHPVYEHGENGKEAFYKVSELEKLKSDFNTSTHTSEIVGGDVTEVDGGKVTGVDGGAIAQQSLVLTIREIVLEVLNAVRITQVRSPLESYRELEEAVSQEWILPTSVIKQLIKVKPHGEEFTRGSFRFVRAGKVGGEAGWLVEKISSSKNK